MSNTSDLNAIANEVKLAQDQCSQLELLTYRFKDFSKVDAYAVAHLVHEMRLSEGLVPVGRKIGFTNPKMWEVYGVSEPMWGYVYDTTLVQAEPTEVRCHVGQFAEPRIEPEIVVHFASPAPDSGDLREILACIDWIAHGIEIVQSHFPGWRFRGADCIADGGLHARLIVGEPREVNLLGAGVISDLENLEIILTCDDDVRDRGLGSNALGNPLRAVAHLIAVIANQPQAEPLQAGELVTTGTLTAAFPIQAGQVWTTNLNGMALPGISVSFET